MGSSTADKASCLVRLGRRSKRSLGLIVASGVEIMGVSVIDLIWLMMLVGFLDLLTMMRSEDLREAVIWAWCFWKVEGKLRASTR